MKIVLVFIGLVISFLFVCAVGLTVPINQMPFFQQFGIFAILFFIAFPHIMILISNLFLHKAGRKSWDNWFKISLQPEYDYIFTIIAIMPCAFLGIEAAVYCNIHEIEAFVVASLFLVPLLAHSFYKKMLRKLYGYEVKADTFIQSIDTMPPITPIDEEKDMTPIEAQIIKEKKSEEVIYSFVVNGEPIKAHFVTGRNPELHIQHNETTLGTIIWKVDKKRRFEYTVNTNAEPLNISAWIEETNSRYRTKNIGLEVNGVPVKYTLSDPQVVLMNKLKFWCSWLYLAVFILFPFGPFHTGLKAVFKILPFIYFVPVIVAIVAIFIFKTWTLSALLLNAYFLALEMGYMMVDMDSYSGLFIVIWIFVRMAVFCALCYIFKKEREHKKAGYVWGLE